MSKVIDENAKVAKTGKEALALYAKHCFDFVLLDIQLPDMTGFDIAAKLRQSYAKLPPLIAVTANVIKDKAEYLNQGMDEAISKPFTCEELAKVIACFDKANSALSIKPAQQQIKANAAKSANNSLVEKLLDLPMLISYLQSIETSVMLDNLALFKQLMPDYLAALDLNLMAKDQQGIVNEAHKIKSAASAVGLKNISELANKTQSPALPAWEDHIKGWVDEIKQSYLHDIKVLENWLAKNTNQIKI